MIDEKFKRGSYDFNKDVKVGDDGEIVVKEFLERYGHIFICYNKDKRYDLKFWVRGAIKLYEVKTDIYCNPNYDTGNISIEFKYKGFNSGINTTTADCFVYYYKHLKEMWFIDMEILRKLIRENNFEVKPSGDNRKSDCYLIPRKQYQKYFDVVKL